MNMDGQGEFSGNLSFLRSNVPSISYHNPIVRGVPVCTCISVQNTRTIRRREPGRLTKKVKDVPIFYCRAFKILHLHTNSCINLRTHVLYEYKNSTSHKE